MIGVRSVCTNPGHTEVTKMSVSASVLAKLIVTLFSAAFELW